jgi:hypothetical protein
VRRRTAGGQGTWALTGARLIAIPVAAKAARGVGAHCRYMVGAKAVEAATDEVCRNRAVRLWRRRLTHHSSPELTKSGHLLAVILAHRVARRRGKRGLVGVTRVCHNARGCHRGSNRLRGGSMARGSDQIWSSRPQPEPFP